MKKRNVAERFWENVDVRSEKECWNWTGKNIHQKGYGQIKFKDKSLLAHRVSMMFHLNTLIVPEECVLHTCDNRLCVNPNHLYIGNRKDNANDREIRHRGGKHYGEYNGRSKLDADKILKIKEMYALKNITQKEIADKFGVSQITISRIVTNRNWKRF